MKLKPIKSAPKDRYILLFAPSGYTTTPLRCEVGAWSGSHWRNHASDHFSDGGAAPVWWCDLPGDEREWACSIDSCHRLGEYAASIDGVPHAFCDEHSKGFAALRALLKTKPSKPPSLEWQPIESSPKDGTMIIGGKYSDNAWTCFGVCWDEDSFWSPHKDGASSVYDLTHWTPCPTPPKK